MEIGAIRREPLINQENERVDEYERLFIFPKRECKTFVSNLSIAKEKVGKRQGPLNVVGTCDDPKETDKDRCAIRCGGTMTDVTDHDIGRRSEVESAVRASVQSPRQVLGLLPKT